VSFVHCIHRYGHLKTEHTESLIMLRRHLGNWPRGPAVGMRSELLVAHDKLGTAAAAAAAAADGVRCARVR